MLIWWSFMFCTRFNKLLRILSTKMEKKYHIVGTILKSNRQIVNKKTKVKLIPLTHTYMTAQWHNSPQIDMLRQSDTLCWLRSNQALFPYLNVLCLTVKQPLQFYCSWIASMGNRTYALLHSWQACQKRSFKWIEPRHHVA